MILQASLKTNINKINKHLSKLITFKGAMTYRECLDARAFYFKTLKPKRKKQ